MNGYENDHGGLTAAVRRCADVLDVNGRGVNPQEILERIRQMQDELWSPAAVAESSWGRWFAAARLRLLGRELNRVDSLLGQVGRLAMPRYVPSGRPGLLYITHFDVFSRNGGAARVLGLGKALSAKYDVRIISLVGPTRSPEIVVAAPGCRVCFIPLTSAFVKEVEALRPRFGGASESLAFTRHHELIPLLREWIERFVEDAQVCILNQPYLVGLWQSIGRRPPLVYDTPEVNSFFIRRLADGCPGVDEASAWQEEVERAVLNEASLITMVSVADRDELVKLRGGRFAARIRLVPNGIDVAETFFAPPGVGLGLRQNCGLTREAALFIGAPRYRPNEEAIRFMARQLAPRLRELLFVVVGVRSGDVPSLGPLPENIVFTGRLTERDKKAVMALCSYGLAPLEFDTGSSLKTVDYLAAGKVMVSTRFGLRGFDELAAHVRVADLDDFATVLEKAVGETRNDRSGVDARCAAARKAVADRFDWNVITQQLLAGLPELPVQTGR
ncbi:MAG TPA: glycosyltransferase family 4 protein [Kiritimatiellia bacterium]|nr:glycosyltransferase family 4 protein [Kiritimatiellia bacterium]